MNTTVADISNLGTSHLAKISVRCNGIERQIFLHVDKSNELIDVQINQILGRLSHTDTEIETLPILELWI